MEKCKKHTRSLNEFVATDKRIQNSRRPVQAYNPNRDYIFTLYFIGRKEIRIKCNSCQTVRYFRKVNNWNKLPYQWWVCRGCSDNQTSNKKGVL